MISLFHEKRVSVPLCDFCGEAHEQAALCTTFRKRGMTRRSFLFMGGTAAVGLALNPQIVIAQPAAGEMIHRELVGKLVAEAWNNVMRGRPDPFATASFFTRMQQELGRIEMHGGPGKAPPPLWHAIEDAEGVRFVEERDVRAPRVTTFEPQTKEQVLRRHLANRAARARS